MYNGLSVFIDNELLQKKIADISYLGAEYLTFSLSNIKTMQLAVRNMQEFGSDEAMITIAKHQITQVKKVEHWLTTESENLLDFVVDLQDLVNALFLVTQQELISLLS